MSKISIFFFSTFLSILLTGFLLSDSRDVSKEKLDAYLIEILPIFQLKGLSYHYRDTTLSTTQGIGLYSHEDKKAIVKNSIFPLGNFSRVLLTLCFFRLEKMGKVNLENPLSLYFNSLSAKKSNPLTVRNLLESRVGLTYRNDEILFSENNNWILSIKDMEIDLLSQLQTLDQSDRSYKSVLETLLLMEILKEITKSNYVDFIKKEINIPLDVNFIFDLNVAKKKGLVSYTNFFNSTSKINHIKYNKFISPAIQVYGSMEDVVKVVEFILDPSSEFISKENKRKFFAPSSYFEDSDEMNYSLGFINIRSNKEFIYNLMGEGGSGVIRLFNSKKNILVILTNYEAGNSILQLSSALIGFLTGDSKETLISSNNERLATLLGIALISISIIFFILHAFFINEFFSIDSEHLLNKPQILFRFLFSLGSFLIILWIRYLFLPSLDAMSQFTMRFDSSSIYGWKIELYFGFIAILFVSFVSSISHGIILSKFNEK